MEKDIMFQEVQYIVAVTMQANAEFSQEDLKKRFENVTLHDVKGDELESIVKVLHIKEEAEIYDTEVNTISFAGTPEEIENLENLIKMSKMHLPNKV